MDALERQPSDGAAAAQIITRLRDAGYAAVLAGGCVRDALLGLAPQDFDIATSARPEDVLRLYPKARRVGVKFGVVLVRRLGQDIEVATFRADGPYSDGRHPDAIRYGTPEQDARRRDFTINGLFLDPATGEVIDHVNGQEDLRAKIIRTIGAPAERFAEDHLRMLRAVRFAARLGFTIEALTFSEMRRLAPLLSRISAERIAQELAAILTPPTRALGWRLLCESQLCDFLAPQWKPDAATRALIGRRLGALPSEFAPFPLVLATLWCAESPDAARAHARALRCSNRDTRAVTWLLSKLAAVNSDPALELAALKRMRGDRDWPLLPPLLRADAAVRAGNAEWIQRFLDRVAVIPLDKITPPPLLNGDEVLALGVPPGKELGAMLELLYTAQLNEVIHSRADAVNLLRRHQTPPRVD